MSKICGRCGASVPDNSAFCTNCGSPLSSQSPSRQQSFGGNGAGGSDPSADRKEQIHEIVNIALAALLAIQLLAACFIRPGWLNKAPEDNKRSQITLSVLLTGGDIRE